MKSIRFYLLGIAIFFIALNAGAQNGIVHALQNAPKSELKSLDSVISFINEHALNEQEKALGAYYYVATHIDYDIKKFIKDKPSNSVPADVFKKEKAVCIGYAKFYQYICQGLGLECEVVVGYSKGFGYKKGQPFLFSDHAWNVVKVNSTWQLVDVTWASGTAKKKFLGYKFKPHYSRDYFEVPPKDFVLKHLPEAPMWQLVDNPVPLKAFTSGDKEISKHFNALPPKIFYYKDTINSYLLLDTAARGIVYGEMVLCFNKFNTLPLSQAIMVSIGNKVMKDSLIDRNTLHTPMDSLIHENSKAIDLLRKTKKCSRKSVNEAVRTTLLTGLKLQGALYYLKADALEKSESLSGKSFDSVLYVAKPLLRSLENGVICYREAYETRLTKMFEEHLGQQYLKFLNLYYSFLKDEKNEATRKAIQNEMLAIKKNAKKYLSPKRSTYNEIANFSVKVS